MKRIFKKAKRKAKLLSVGFLTTTQFLLPQNRKNETHAKILNNQYQYFNHFNNLCRARQVIANVDIDKEIEKRAVWFQKNLLKRISEEDKIVKYYENMVRKAKTRKEARIINNKLDMYITQKYLDEVNTERVIRGKEPYCLGFVMSNMMNYEEFQNAFRNFPGVAKLANKYFVSQAKLSYRDFIVNAKQRRVKPEVGDIIVIKRPNNTYHAVTYIGKNKTFSANGSDHGGQSELKVVNFSHWWMRAGNLYVFKSKDMVKKYWKDKYNSNEMSKLEFLAKIYEGREMPKEVDLLLKDGIKLSKTFFTRPANKDMNSVTDKIIEKQLKSLSIDDDAKTNMALNNLDIKNTKSSSR
jgi:hypothetical protein